MQKIKRTYARNSNGIGTFLKTLLIMALCIVMIVAGYFAASYFSKMF